MLNEKGYKVLAIYKIGIANVQLSNSENDIIHLMIQQ